MTTPSPLLNALIDGKYRIRTLLGEGGVGAVYEAENVEIKKPVAIKVLHALYATSDEFRRRFEREARAASRLSHPACVSVLDYGRIRTIDAPAASAWVGAPYLVLEFVRGKLLADRLDAGPMDITEALMITRGLLSALKHAHGLGIVHRDVKPANIMIRPSGDHTGPIIKLLDFGLAKEVTPDRGEWQEKDAVTQAGMVFGTPGYLSPEQASGQTLDGRADLYSVGVILYELVCGQRPFVGKDPLETARMHLSQPPTRPQKHRRELSNELESVILKALAKSPNDRYQKAEEMSAALATCPEARVASVAPVASELPDTEVRTPRSSPRELRVTFAAIGISAVMLLCGIAFPRAKADPAALVAEGHLDDAVQNARGVLKTNRKDARTRVALGIAYQRKLWCSDAIEELGKALDDDPTLKADPAITRSLIACLGTKTQAKAARLLAEVIGPAAISELRSAAVSHPTDEIRRAAQRLANDLETGKP